MGDVTVSGPLFDGQAQAALDAYAERLPDDIAQEGQQMVRDHLNLVLRQNLGVYVSRVHVRHDFASMVIENDMVYSPWLEGIDERNRSTRFKGYHTFRIIGQRLDDEAEGMAEDILRPYLEEMR